jgi:hypothetical protein
MSVLVTRVKSFRSFLDEEKLENDINDWIKKNVLVCEVINVSLAIIPGGFSRANSVYCALVVYRQQI